MSDKTLYILNKLISNASFFRVEIKCEVLFWSGNLNGVYLEEMNVDGRAILTETMGRDSAVGMATHYELDFLGIESQ